MNNNCREVDDLLLQMADYKKDFATVAAEKLLRNCSTSWLAYQYLQVRVHEPWLPDQARQEVRRIITRLKVRVLAAEREKYLVKPERPSFPRNKEINIMIERIR